MSIGVFFFCINVLLCELSAAYTWQYAFTYLHKSFCRKIPLMFTSFDGKTCDVFKKCTVTMKVNMLLNHL